MKMPDLTAPPSLRHADKALQLLAKKNRGDTEQAVKEIAHAIFAIAGLDPPNYNPQRGPVVADIG